MIIMALASLASAGIGAATGKNAQQSSSFSGGQKGGINDILNSIKSMRGGAQDISQQPGFQQGNDWLMSMFNDPDFFKNFEAPLQRQFQEQTVPDLANRFASMGSGGALGSTGFRNQLGREGSNLSTNIAAQRGQMQQQAIPQLLGYSQQPFSNLATLQSQALGQPMMNQYQPATPGAVGNLAGPLAAGAANYWGGQGGQQGGMFAGQSPSTGPGYGMPNSLGGQSLPGYGGY